MIEYLLRCDKCKRAMEAEWTKIYWKSGDEGTLCKDCTRAFNRWLKE